MMRLLPIIFVFLGTIAQAQSIPVRAGEHEDFTRIVMPIPENTDWELGRISGGYGVRLSRAAEFVTDGFFSIIPRDRVDAVAASPNGTDIGFALNCICRASAYMTSTRWLVIDISEGQPDPNSTFEFELTGFQSMSAPSRISPVARVDQQPSRAVPRPSEEVPEQTAQVELPVTIDIPKESNLNLGTLNEQAEQSDRLNQLEQAVSSSLARALSQGLLEPSASNDLGPLEADLGELDQLLVDVASLRGPGVEARTSLDDGLGLASAELSESPDQLRCENPSDFAIASWGDDRPFPIQLAERRTGLVGEFDRPDSVAIENLAKLYLYFGFGREASATLSIDGYETAKRQNLIAIAEIMDGEDAPSGDLTFQLQCAPPLSFWGLLSHQNGPLPSSVDHQAIVQTFRDLPFHLQVHLGPRTAEKLRQSGHEDAARIVLENALEEPQVSPEATLQEVQLLVDNQQISVALERLEGLSEDDGRASPLALIQQIKLKMANDENISEEEIAALGSLRFEGSDPSIRAALLEAEIEVGIYNEDFLYAHDLLAENQSEFDKVNYVELKEDLFTQIHLNSDDAEFVTLTFGDELRDMSPSLQNSVAGRLIRLGFLDRAEELIQQQTIGTELTERRYLRAEISSIRGDFEAARAHLIGMNSQRTEAILNDAILPVEGRLEDILIPDELAWQERDWEELLSSDDTLLRSVADRNLSETNDPFGSTTPLRQSAELLADSEELRRTVADLFERFESP